jgi:predicted membrane protein
VTPDTPSPRPGGSKSLSAIILIVLGIVLFLDNLGIPPFNNVRAFWPLAISAFGLAQLTGSRSRCCTVWPWALIIIGVLLTLGNLHLLHVNGGGIWAVILIALGVSMLLNRGRVAGPVRFRDPGAWHRPAAGSGTIYENVFFSSLNRRVESQNFEGADLQATFGELKLDLRNVTISTPNRQAIIETNARFGGIKLRVPETWKIMLEGSAVFGTYEDRTVPPRPVPGVDHPPTLIIRGNAVFGAVEIEN